MTNESKILPERVDYIESPVSLWQRIKCYLNRLRQVEFPEKTEWVRVILNPGDPGYENAFLVVTRTTYVPLPDDQHTN